MSVLLPSSKERQIRRVCCFNQYHEEKYLYRKALQNKNEKKKNHVLRVFLVLFVFQNKKTVFKNYKQPALNLKNSSLLLIKRRTNKKVCCFNQCHEGKIFIQQAFLNKKEKNIFSVFSLFLKTRNSFQKL